MPHVATRQRNGFRRAARCPRRIPKQHKEDWVGAQCARRWIMSYVHIAVTPVVLLVIKRQTDVDVLASFRQQTTRPICRPGGVMRLEQDLRIVQLASDPIEIGGNLIRPIKPTPV
jgi:hypothetical protein